MSDKTLKAYAIFDGGGVLGAALAGCLKAADDFGIEFVGFGGTSAGSIVATLGAVGMSADQIEEIVVGTDFTEFLAEDGRPVERFKAKVAAIASRAERLRFLNFPRHLPPILLGAFALQKLVGGALGIDDGKSLKKRLHKAIGEHRKNWSPAKKADIAFSDLDNEPGCFPLKIVASDVTKRRPVVFEHGSSDYGTSVLDAVRASTCYPIVFHPFQWQQRRLVDGGLSSNLPAALFHWEQARTNYPVFAFDLVSEEAEPPSASAPYPLKKYLGDMVSTAIDAGDELMRGVLKNVFHIPVPIPDSYDVLDFRISRERRRELFRIGYNEVSRYLNASDLLSFLSSLDPSENQKRLQARWGPPSLYQPVLAAVAREIEAATDARNIRATIMLPIHRNERMVVYHHGMSRRSDTGKMQDDPDIDLVLPEDGGVSGRAWRLRRAIVADLDEARLDPSLWKISHTHMGKIPPHRKSMISVPILRRIDEPDGLVELPIGTLTLDSDTPLSETSWVRDGSRDDLSAAVVSRLERWAEIAMHLLLSDE